MSGDYPEGVSTYDIDKNFGPVCTMCGEPIYSECHMLDWKGDPICDRCFHNEYDW